jgi:hypothetical protein
MKTLFDTQEEFYYYKVADIATIIKQKIGETCYIKYCYKIECQCQSTTSCDLEEGETIKSAFPQKVVEEIDREEFDKLYANCHK